MHPSHYPLAIDGAARLTSWSAAEEDHAAIGVHVRKEDAPLVRGVVKALTDPSREFQTRALLRERFGASKASGLKALLASAPLEGIDLSRNRDFGRDIEL
jgi:hypothetical protein